MRKFFKTIFFSLLAITTFAQQATEIDSKSLKLPRYTNLSAIQTAIPSAQQGMMVYNIGTASNWYYNGTAWANMAGGGSSAWISSPYGIYPTTISQNVGIGMDQPLDKLEINGNMALMHNSSLEFGKYIAGKETNAGRIGYGIFTPNTLDIVGAGNTYLERKLRFWAEGGSTFEGKATFNGNVGVGTNIANQRLEVNGKIKIADDANTPVAGNIRYNATTNDFEGYNGTVWKSFTQPNGFWGSLNDVVAEVTASSVISYGGTTTGTAKAMLSDNYMALLYKENTEAVPATKFYKWENNNWVFMNQITGDLIGKMTDDWVLVPNAGTTTAPTSFALYKRNNNVWEFHSSIGSGLFTNPYGSQYAIDGDKFVITFLGAGSSSTNYIDIYKYNGTLWTLHQTITDPALAMNNDYGSQLQLKKEYLGIGYGFLSSNDYVNIYKFNGTTFVLNSSIFQKYLYKIHFEGSSVRIRAITADFSSSAGGIYKIGTSGLWELLPNTLSIYDAIEGFGLSYSTTGSDDFTLKKYENDQYNQLCEINYEKIVGSETFGNPILSSKAIIIPSTSGYQILKRP